MSVATRVAHIVLGRRQLYMLPTRHGLLFALVLATLLLAAINYSNGLAYALAFLLASIATMSMLHTHRNLAGLRITAGPCPQVFVGQQAEFTICLENVSGPDRLGIVIEHDKNEVAQLNLWAQQQRCITLTLPARQRGLLAAPVFRVSTQYPLGLLYSWSRRIALDQHCVVYPQPAAHRPLVFSGSAKPHHAGNYPEGDDFIGLRDYRPGDSPRHISWKIVARGQGTYTKEFGAGRHTTTWLDWNDLPGLDTEERLRRLCRWVLDAEENGVFYGLRLPNYEVPPGSGFQHCHCCLNQLALFQE